MGLRTQAPRSHGAVWRRSPTAQYGAAVPRRSMAPRSYGAVRRGGPSVGAQHGAQDRTLPASSPVPAAVRCPVWAARGGDGPGAGPGQWTAGRRPGRDAVTESGPGRSW